MSDATTPDPLVPTPTPKKKSNTGKIIGFGCGGLFLIIILLFVVGIALMPSEEEVAARKRAERHSRDSSAAAAIVADSMKKVQAKAAFDALPQAHKDSVKRAEKAIADSIQRRADVAKAEAAQAVRKARKDSLHAVWKADAERRAAERPVQSSSETYNGHEIHTGPRGGRYYINENGNKTYIKR